MVKTSAGILAFRMPKQGVVEVLLVHPGGPFYQKKDSGIWSIPKGEYTEREVPLGVAKKEFTEETGNVILKTPFVPLKMVKNRSGMGPYRKTLSRLIFILIHLK